MRLLSLILSIYVLILAGVPCSDFCQDDHANLKEVIHHDADAHGELCSPFCMCSCCRANMVFFAFEAFNISKPSAYNPVNPVFDQTAVFSFSLPVWQPPKI